MNQLKDYFQISGLAVAVQKENSVLCEDYMGHANVEQKL